MTLRKLDDGTWAHHGIQPGTAHICISYMGPVPTWDVYRSDGLWAKKIACKGSEEQANDFCNENGLRPVRG